MVQIIQAHGHVVAEARNGREGVSRFKASRPDLVVTDIIMPDREGIEAIRDLRSPTPDLRIVAISGGGGTGNLDFLDVAKEFGAVRVWGGPFEPRELLDTVTLALS